MSPLESSARRDRSSRSCSAICCSVASGRPASREPATRSATGRRSQSSTTRRACSGSASIRARPARPASSSTPCSGSSGPRGWCPAAGRLGGSARAVTMTAESGPAGSSGVRSTDPGTSSSTRSSRASASLLRIDAASASRSSGSSRGWSPVAVRIRRSAATARDPPDGVRAPRVRKSCPSAYWAATRCATCSASAVFPTPGGPDTTQTAGAPVPLVAPRWVAAAAMSASRPARPGGAGGSFSRNRPGSRSGFGRVALPGERDELGSCVVVEAERVGERPERADPRLGDGPELRARRSCAR